MTASAAGMPVGIDSTGAAVPTLFSATSALAPTPGGVPVCPTAVPQPPEVRWALLLDDLMRMRERLPPPRARRIGDPAPGPGTAPPEWLEPARAWLAGMLSRYCDIRAPRSAFAGALTDGEIEARLMILAADHLLAERVDWAGRPWWDADHLARALLGRPAMDMPMRAALQAKLATGDPTLARVVPALRALGLSDRLFPTPQECALCERLPPPLPAPASPVPADPFRIREGEPRPGRRRARLRAAAFGAALAVPAALLVWQAMLWHGFLARLGTLLSAG